MKDFNLNLKFKTILIGNWPEILCPEDADNDEEVAEKSEQDYEKEHCTLKRI